MKEAPGATYLEVRQVTDRSLSSFRVKLVVLELVEPGVFQGFLGGEAILHVHLHQLADEVLSRFRNGFPDASLERPLTGLDLCENLAVATVEGRSATQHDIEDHTDAPHVTHLVVLACENLGRDVVGSPVHGSHLLALILAEVVTSAEVDHFNGATLSDVNENVLWLEITVGNLLTVAVGNSLQQLLEDFGSLGLLEIFLLDNLVEELAALAKLCHKEESRLVFVDFKEPHDVRVSQISENVNFILETVSITCAHRQFVNDLDGELLPGLVVCDPLHSAERACAQQLFVDIVLLGEEFHISVLFHEVGVLDHDVILVLEGFLFCHGDEALRKRH